MADCKLAGTPGRGGAVPARGGGAVPDRGGMLEICDIAGEPARSGPGSWGGRYSFDAFVSTGDNSYAGPEAGARLS